MKTTIEINPDEIDVTRDLKLMLRNRLLNKMKDCGETRIDKVASILAVWLVDEEMVTSLTPGSL